MPAECHFLDTSILVCANDRMEPVKQAVAARLVVDGVRSGVHMQHRHQLSYWDALILAAARIAGCGEVLSEDLNHGQTYGGVTVRNPFR